MYSMSMGREEGSRGGGGVGFGGGGGGLSFCSFGAKAN